MASCEWVTMVALGACTRGWLFSTVPEQPDGRLSGGERWWPWAPVRGDGSVLLYLSSLMATCEWVSAGGPGRLHAGIALFYCI